MEVLVSKARNLVIGISFGSSGARNLVEGTKQTIFLT